LFVDLDPAPLATFLLDQIGEELAVAAAQVQDFGASGHQFSDQGIV
jgi:hypothetical protein